jgi:EAL domain-containing protein (putative c-di-GMP-specific phosphodiesterase class I)
VSRLGRDKSSAAIIAAINALATALGLKTIAEGVETKEQLEQLIKLGCAEIQGFYVARPQPLTQLGCRLAMNPVAARC